MKKNCGFLKFSLFSFLIFSVVHFSSCAYFKPKKPAQGAQKHQKTIHAPAKTQARPVDTQAQQKYYDLGLKYYSEENYAESKKAWQQVMRLGPSTPLAEKAREYLKKTDQILKTLNEIEKK